MAWKDNVLVEIDDISIYYNMINMVSPRTILDIGMFLKRIGAVSRRNLNAGIENKVILDGVDYMPDLKIPVMQKVYDNIFSVRDFFDLASQESGINGYYDLVVMLYPETEITPDLERIIWHKISQKAKYILTNLKPEEERDKRILLPANTKDVLQVNDRYGLFVLD